MLWAIRSSSPARTYGGETADALPAGNTLAAGRFWDASTARNEFSVEAKFAEDLTPIDPESPIAPWSRAYLHHLVKSGEMLGAMLMTEHNLSFYQQLMAKLRAAIGAGELAAFASRFRDRYARAK